MANPLNNYIGIGKESTYGIAVSPTTYLKINESDGISINKDSQYVESIIAGVQAKNKEVFDGKIEYTGGYELALNSSDIGLILLSALGDVTSEQVTGETTVYKHTFSESLTKLSLTIEQKIGEIVKRFTGFLVNSIKIEGSAGDVNTFSFEGFAKTQVDNVETTPTYSTERSFNFADVLNIKVGGVDYRQYVEEFSFEYKWDGEGFYGLGQNELVAPVIKTSEVSGSFTMYLNNTTKAVFDKFVNSENTDIEIVIKGNSIGTASNRQIKITIPKAKLEEASTSLSTDYNAVEVSFNGVYDFTTNKLLTIELINTVANY
jgi:hypothetical protein